MKFLNLAILSLFAIPQAFAAKEKAPRAEAKIVDANGAEIGTATFEEMPKGGVMVRINAKGLSPGEHGIHFHENGKCEGPKFTSAGGHFNPSAHEHGLASAKGPHAGDLQNLVVNKDGTATVTLSSKLVILAQGKNSLLKEGGTALVIHASADDHKTNPSGNSGDRIACGVIQPLRY